MANLGVKRGLFSGHFRSIYVILGHFRSVLTIFHATFSDPPCICDDVIILSMEHISDNELQEKLGNNTSFSTIMQPLYPSSYYHKSGDGFGPKGSKKSFVIDVHLNKHNKHLRNITLAHGRAGQDKHYILAYNPGVRERRVIIEKLVD